MLRPASEAERTRILAALPAAVHEPRHRGAVASVLLEEEGALLDGAVALDDAPEAWVRRLVPGDGEGLDACLALLERRRAKIVHDASGPAMGMLAALETVLEYEPITDATRALLEDTRRGLLRMTKRLADRSEALSQQPNIVAGSLDGLLARLARPTLEALGQEGLHVELRASREEARVDAALVEGALATLLSNAWSARRGQEVAVEVEGAIEGELLRVTVRDDGVGIDRETALCAGALGFAGRANGAGIGLFHLRRALARRKGVFLIQTLRPGACATVLVPAIAASGSWP